MSEPLAVEVVVEVPEPEAVVEPEATPEVVVVVEAEPDAEPSTAPVEIDHEKRLTILEMGQTQILDAIGGLAALVGGAQQTAEIAAEDAAVAVEIAAEASDEGQASAEADESPDYEHPWFKNRKRK